MTTTPATPPLTVCVLRRNRGTYSNTFIQAHIERLPARVHVLTYGWYGADGRRYLPAPLHLPYRLAGFSYARQTGALARMGEAAVRLGDFFTLKHFLQRQQIDVVLAEYGQTGALAVAACTRAGVPLVVHFHGYDAYMHSVLQEYGAAYQRMFAQASAIIAVSRDMEQQLLRLGARRETLFYNPYGVDLTLFANANPAAAPPTFVATGRFVEKKAPHLTLLAFSRVVQQHPDARLVMIGAGELLNACKHLAAALHIAHAVEFRGAQPHHSVAAAMQQARAFVQHSVRAHSGDSEGTPVAVLEAGGAGLPVVATRHAGIRDTVLDGETGLLVDELDVDGMAAHMLRLVNDPLLAAALGQRARNHIASTYGMEQRIRHLYTILVEAAST